jgi:hypothetical protein
MRRPPGGGAGLELPGFVRPGHEPGSRAAMSTELGLRNVAFEVDDLQAALDQLPRGRLRPGWRRGSIRAPLAHGLRTRTRGNHRAPGRADRLMPPSANQAACSRGRNPGCSGFSASRPGGRPRMPNLLRT